MPSLMRNEMSNLITLDDLTYEDLSIIRTIYKHKVYRKKCTLSESEFIKSAIDGYNKGDYSIVSMKAPLEESLEESFDLFTDEIIPLLASNSPVVLDSEPQSNIGKKIDIENSMGHKTHFILVGNSEEADPDNKKISIFCDLGKLLVNAKNGDIIEHKDLLIAVTNIT